ncbi:MAG: phosphomethylpyrimidine synthase [Chthoniobacter sp.]|nr:phosphomethylpyrimidine synthase [Chthoniobacter sp.]
MLRDRSVVNITEDVRKYAAEQAISEEDALKKGMEEKSKEFVEKGAEVSFLRSNFSAGQRAAHNFAKSRPVSLPPSLNQLTTLFADINGIRDDLEVVV